jgi:hypothetical protein
MSAVAAKRRVASGRRSSDDLPENGCDSTRRAMATLGDDDSVVRTSWRSGRGLFRTRSDPQILLKTLLFGPPLGRRSISLSYATPALSSHGHRDCYVFPSSAALSYAPIDFSISSPTS